MLDFFNDKQEKKDELTQVYNREVIFSFIDLLISKNNPFTFCILDVDNFKYVNDGYRHKVGDRALMEIAKRMEELVGDKGVVGRYGGDEYVMVFPNIVLYDDVWQELHDVLKCTKGLPSKDLDELNMTATIGCARFPEDATNIDSLFELADKALYRGKMKGRNCFIIYLAAKHAQINLKTERDKVVSTTYIHSMIFNKVTQSDLKSGIVDAINYIGSYFMIDHLCLVSRDKLYYDYYHPICKLRNFEPFTKEIMENGLNAQTKIFYKNSIEDNLAPNIVKAWKKQGIYSSFWIEIETHDKFFGYLRADICSNPTGRVWQTQDMNVLANFAHLIALELFYRDLDIEEL